MIVAQVSWKGTLTVFDARLANVTLEHGAQLQRWKETVTEVYSDFEAKLPDAEPTPLSSRTKLVDGRTEGSRYPNLMVPGVNQRHIWSVVDTSAERMSMYQHYWEGQDPFQRMYPHPPGHPS